ncbi:hypothetical protein XH84_10685 [Bradyrhizobium nanningense]|nr:hypothetical protein XH84_10685 [Bradyrhizobium nanningense]
MDRSGADHGIEDVEEIKHHRAEVKPSARSPVAGTVDPVKPYTASGRHLTNHAYLDRLTAPSDSMMRQPGVDNEQNHELGGVTFTREA